MSADGTNCPHNIAERAELAVPTGSRKGINGIAVCKGCGQACHVRDGVWPDHGCRG